MRRILGALSHDNPDALLAAFSATSIVLPPCLQSALCKDFPRPTIRLRASLRRRSLRRLTPIIPLPPFPCPFPNVECASTLRLTCHMTRGDLNRTLDACPLAGAEFPEATTGIL